MTYVWDRYIKMIWATQKRSACHTILLSALYIARPRTCFLTMVQIVISFQTRMINFISFLVIVTTWFSDPKPSHWKRKGYASSAADSVFDKRPTCYPSSEGNNVVCLVSDRENMQNSFEHSSKWKYMIFFNFFS